MNLGNILDQNINKYGEYNAYWFEGKWWTNVELNKTANKIGNALKKLGIKRGDRVVTQLPNCIEVLATFAGVYKIGAVMLPMNPILRPEQIGYIYKDSGARVTLTTSDYLPWVKEAQKNVPDLEYVILIDKDGVEGTLYLPKLLAEASDRLVTKDMDNDELAALVYTSGTTGNPKGVMMTHYALWINAIDFWDFNTNQAPTTVVTRQREFNPRTFKFEEKLREVSGLDRNNPFLTVLPLSHSMGICFMNFNLLAGASNIVMKWWNPEEAMKLIEKFRITFMTLVPTMYIHILDNPNVDKYDLSSMTYCASGGAALSTETAIKWHDKFGVYITEGWGMTETGAIASGTPSGRPPKFGSVGISALSSVKISVVDEKDKEVPAGATGELVIKGPTVMKGYWNLPEETSATLKNGWMHTGDIGHRDEDGYFYVTDRKKDLIIRGGENISPKEVEEVICQYAKVVEAGCIGIPDRVYGEEVKAYVVLKANETCTEQEIIEYCSKSLPTFKRPKKVEFITALPKNLLGKILRAELRKLNK
jgi:long-chain acyl-CoA synthetase